MLEGKKKKEILVFTFIDSGFYKTFNNRRKNLENSWSHCPSDSIRAYVHTPEQPAKSVKKPAKSCKETVTGGDFRRLLSCR